MPDALENEPRLREECAHVWRWFQELAAARRSGFGPDPISFADIDAWARLTARRPRPWEVRALRAIDGQWLSLAAEKQKKEIR